MAQSSFKIRRDKTGQAGFTLLEMSFVVLISGLLLVAAIAIAMPIFRTAAMLQTQAKLDNIAKALDYYASVNYRVPCPAVPDTATAAPSFGYENGSGANGDLIPPNCDNVPWEGIVPFKALNIPSDWARDAWGHYITYAISPAFSRDVNDATIPVHKRCRTADWFAAGIVYEQSVLAAGATNSFVTKNARKVRFCCSGALLGAATPPGGGPPSDLVILDANNQSQMAQPRQTLATSYDVAANPFPAGLSPQDAADDPASVIANTDRPSAPVYILISHGPNGYGAYLGQGAGVRTGLGGATAAERENANGDRVFYEIPKIDRANAERSFDDIVEWRSQDLIFAGLGKSCSLP